MHETYAGRHDHTVKPAPHAALASALVLALSGCAKPRPAIVVPQNRATTPVIYPEPTVIYRETSYPEDSLAARGLGTIALVVRVADQPLRVVANAIVLVRASADGRDTQRVADERGQVQFDSVVVGRRQITVRAIGYGQAKFEALVVPGCRSDIEVYIGVQAMGIAPPPPQPGRAVITTCRPAP